MDRMAVLTVCLALLFSVPAYAAGASADSSDRHGSRNCDNTRELEAAKRALANGDREAAVDHLLRADEILAACEQDPPEAGPGAPSEEPERMFASSPEREALSLQAPEAATS
jgi:hypothetical protein